MTDTPTPWSVSTDGALVYCDAVTGQTITIQPGTLPFVALTSAAGSTDVERTAAVLNEEETTR